MTIRSILTAAAVATGFVASAQQARATTVTVYVFSFEFSTRPPTMFPLLDPTITIGDTIRWEWLNSGHNVHAAANQREFFLSSIRSAGSTFEHTFTQAGSFHYYCDPHGGDNGDGTANGMAGIINVVVPSPAGASALAGAALVAARRRRR